MRNIILMLSTFLLPLAVNAETLSCEAVGGTFFEKQQFSVELTEDKDIDKPDAVFEGEGGYKITFQVDKRKADKMYILRATAQKIEGEVETVVAAKTYVTAMPANLHLLVSHSNLKDEENSLANFLILNCE